MTRRRKLRLGLSMGTFNPIHIWHLQVAQCAWDQFGLDKVLFIPNGDPPHKEGVVDKELRYRMVEAACANNQHFEPSRIEVDRPGKSCTIDTLRALKAQYGPDVELFLIIGLDNLEPIKRWVKADKIFKLCTLLVAPRNLNLADPASIAAALPQTAKFQVIDCPGGGISSTLIREWTRTGKARSAYYLFPNEKVRRIVMRHRLYRQ